MMKHILFAALGVISLGALAQNNTTAYKFSDEPLDFSPFHTVYKSDVEICDSKSGEGSYMCIFKQMRHDAMNYDMQPYSIKRGGINVDSDNSTVREGAGHQTSAARRQAQAQRKAQRDRERAAFFELRRQQRLEAARRARRVALEKERRSREDDNRRSAQRRGQVNAQLQGTTDRRIASDHWHAGEGCALTQQAAREAIGTPTGMVVTQQAQKKTSGTAIAANMRTNTQRRRQRTPPGGMEYYSRRPMPPVVREPFTPAGEYVFTGRATKTQIYIKKDSRFVFNGQTRGPALARGGQQFRLSPHATVTTGQDWHSTVLKGINRRVPSRPVQITPSRARTAKEYAAFLDEMLSTD